MTDSAGVLAAASELAIRRLEDCLEDYTLLAGWLSDPRVLEFYEGRDHPFSLSMVIETFSPRALGEEKVIPCLLLLAGKPVGYLQFYPADVEEYQFEGEGVVYATDQFIGEPELWGRGYGSRFLRLALGYLRTSRAADWVILDPHADNLRAIRSYEKCGFRKVKLLPAHEWHEGRYADCWLMAADLRGWSRGAVEVQPG